MQDESLRRTPCWDCGYFDVAGLCAFRGVPTTPNTPCKIKLYNLVPACTPETKCISCQFFDKCSGNKDDPIKRLEINPHYGQQRMESSDKQIILALWGSQSGKTSWMPYIMYREMLRCGSGDYIVVSPTYPLQDKALLQNYLQFFHKDYGYVKIGYHKIAKHILEINDGNGLKANIFFASAEKPESLESATALAAHLDEAGQEKFSLSAWEAINRRVSRNRGRIFITTTPYNFGWLYSEIYRRWEDGDPDIDVIQFDSKHSPGFSLRKYNEMDSTMPDWKADMFLRGIFRRPAGQIYSDFDVKRHLISPFTIPQGWNWHVAIDPGAVHTALIWVAEDPAMKKYYIVHSYLDGNKTTSEHVKKAMKFPEFGRVKRWVGGAGNEEQFRMDWRANGIHVREPEIRDVESGIDRVTALLKEDRLLTFNTDENQGLIEQFLSYSRELDDTGQPTDRIQDKNKAHMMDACRYFAVGTSPQFDSSRLLAVSIRSFRKPWRQSAD